MHMIYLLIFKNLVLFFQTMSVDGPECVKTRYFLDSGGASPLAYTEIVAYTRSSEAKFLDPNFIRSFHTASAGSGPLHIPRYHSSTLHSIDS